MHTHGFPKRNGNTYLRIYLKFLDYCMRTYCNIVVFLALLNAPEMLSLTYLIEPYEQAIEIGIAMTSQLDT